MKTFRRVVVGVALVCLLPFAAALMANAAGGLLGCQVDQGGVVWPCPIAGLDVGGALQVINSFSYGTFFTVPLLMLTVAMWLLVEIVHWLMRPRGVASH